MKISLFLPVILLAATFAAGQATPSPATPSQSQAPAQSATPQNAGAAPAQSQAAAPQAGHRVLQAKSQEELKAYQDALTKADPAQAEAAASEFSTKYPLSELRASLYARAMTLYSQANNSDKVIDTGRLAIAADPSNPVPLVQVGAALAETTHESDLDREQRLAEAAKDAHGAIDNIDTGLLVPANADPERVAGAKRSILTMAYDTLGMVDMSRNDYASAVSNLQKAIEQDKNNPEAVLYLRLSVAQDKLKQYSQALESANKAVQYAQEGTPAQNLAKQQQQRLQQLVNSGSPGGAAASAPMGSPSPR